MLQILKKRRGGLKLKRDVSRLELRVGEMI